MDFSIKYPDVEELLENLNDNSRNPDFVLNSLKKLNELTLSNSSNRTKVGDKGGCEIIMHLLTTYQSIDSVTESCLSVIANLSYNLR